MISVVLLTHAELASATAGGRSYWETGELWVNPIEKHVNLIFTGKFVIFFKAPSQGSMILRAHIFASGQTTSVCEWSLTSLITNKLALNTKMGIK